MNIITKNGLESLQFWLKSVKEFQLDNMFDTNVLGRAYLYTKSIKEVKKERNNIVHHIEGTHTYQTELMHQKGVIYGSCSCPSQGNCKHLAASILYEMSTK